MNKSESPQSENSRYSRNLFGADLSAEAREALLNRSEKRSSSWYFSDRDFAPVLEELRKNPPPETAEAGLIYASSGKFVWKLECPVSSGKCVVAYKTNPGKTPWRYILKSSLPVREARNYLRFEKIGLPVARVIAVGDERKNFILKETFIATVFVDGTADGRSFMEEGDHYTDLENKLTFCKLNLELLAKLHHANFFHKAFHPRNLLWRNTGKKMEIFWIDVARCRPFPPRKMAKAVLVDLHTFFRDMQLTRSQTVELLEHYRLFAPAQYIPGTTEELLENLINFRRRLFSRKKYRLFSGE